MEMLTPHFLSELLEANSRIFASIEDLEATLNEIVLAATNLLCVEAATVWMIDESTESRDYLVAKVWTDNTGSHDSLPHSSPAPSLSSSASSSAPSSAPNSPSPRKTFEKRVHISQGLAGWCASNRSLVIVDDAYQDPRFNPEADVATGFKTRSMLSVPIFVSKKMKNMDSGSLWDVPKAETSEEGQHSDSELIGVLQFINKITAPSFNQKDQAVAVMFSLYTGIALNNSATYRKMVQAQLHAKVAMDLLTYHYKIDDVDVALTSDLIKEPQFIEAVEGIDQWCFNPYNVPIHLTPSFVFFMFREIGLIDYLRTDAATMSRYILMAQKGYRSEVLYHNWYHAICVTHQAYLLVKTCNLQRFLTPLQSFMLVLAALTHDVDHRGTNNAFQRISESELAALYSSEGSTLERHHLAQTMCMLTSKGTDILTNLDQFEHYEALSLIRHVILATDLATHFERISDVQAIVPPRFDRQNTTHQLHLMALCITCCDLYQFSKPWAIARSIVDMIYQEFHAQGDLEKKFGRTPIAMMDRDRSNFPPEQISFIDNVALPAYRLLSLLVPDSQEAYSLTLSIRENWQRQL